MDKALHLGRHRGAGHGEEIGAVEPQFVAEQAQEGAVVGGIF